MFKICHLVDLKEKEPYIAKIGDIEVGVIKWKEELHAYENVCPHLGGPVCLGEVFEKVKLEINEDKTVEKEFTEEDDLNLVCPWHGFEFDLETGKSHFGDRFKLRKFRTYLEEDFVFVDLEKGRNNDGK